MQAQLLEASDKNTEAERKVSRGIHIRSYTIHVNSNLLKKFKISI